LRDKQMRETIAKASTRDLRRLLKGATPEQRELIERRLRSERYGDKLRAGSGGGGTGKIDTSAADALFGEELRVLGAAAGATQAQIRKALEAAAGSLKGEASPTVARQAAVGQLESLTGASLSAAGGPEAALFGALTQIGGPQAGRSAADGARFVQVHVTNTFNQTFALELPEGFGDGLRTDVDGVAGSLTRQMTEAWEQVMDRFGQGLEP
jgi:hypothetical protein